jgi:hypothetical protein
VARGLVAAAVLAGAPAAAGTFAPPEGCTGFLTVQSKGCILSNHYRCAGDPPGDQWRVDFGAQGPFFASRTDREAQWVFSVELATGARQWLQPDPADPASLSGLLATGEDTFEFRLRHAGRDGAGTEGAAGGETVVRGRDRLTGRRVVIDGVPLRQTVFDYRETAADGSLRTRARGHEFVHEKWRLFLSGPSEWEVDGAMVPVDHSPVAFILPGEPGFFATEPQYQCDMLMSRAAPAAPSATPAASAAPAPVEEQADDL